MKLRNKKTGEIDDFIFEVITDRIDLYRRVGHSETKNIWHYNSLAELNEDWEDYEEPKEYWYIDWNGEVCRSDIHDERTKRMKQIGNYFETKEEAEKAVEKLKAWERLKDGGITFKNWTINQTGTIDCFATWGDNIPPSRKNPTLLDDLDLLFGGEE